MPTASDTPRPNVLLICTDHWPAALMRPAGHSAIMTPTLQHLADCGVHYTNAYSATPHCVPARRSLMTGLTLRTHRHYAHDALPRPDVTTLAQTFREHGYQATAVGKLHTTPPRSRIGFDDVILNEEGRRPTPNRRADDYEQFLADQGYPGHEFATGLNNNDYQCRAWQLPEHCHPTNWAAREMCRTIQRRDPSRPAFWYLSFTAPHPPLWPLNDYLELYRDVEMDEPVYGDWSRELDRMPQTLRHRRHTHSITSAPPHEQDLARRAFYALCTHIDHQLRTVLGTLREEGLINNTIIAFTSDHGDLLGNHGLWAKTLMYDRAANVPLLIVPRAGDDRLPPRTRDERLVELRDIMPTLLDLAGLPIPEQVEGQSLISDAPRDTLFGEHGTYNPERPHSALAVTRMVRDQRHKLIYYPAGNRVQLFDLHDDPDETRDLADNPAHAETRERLTNVLIDEMYDTDEHFINGGQLVGVPEIDVPDQPPARNMLNQRGWRFV